MHPSRRLLPLLSLFLLALLAPSASAQNNPHVLRLARLLPKSDFVFVVDKLDQATSSLDLLLKKLETTNPFGIQLRGMIGGMEQRLGLSLLSPSFWAESGIDPRGALLLSEIRLGRTAPIVGFVLKNPSQFDSFLQKFLALVPGSQIQKTPFRSSSLVSVLQPLGESSFRTLFSFTIQGKILLLTSGSPSLSSPGQPSKSEKVLQALLSLDPSQTLASHPKFLQTYKTHTGRGKAFLFGENKRKNRLSNPSLLSPPVRGDFDWLAITLDWGSFGLSGTFHVGLGSDPDFQRYAPLFQAPQSAPGHLLNNVHPSALSLLRVAFDTQGFYREILKEAQKSDPSFSEDKFLAEAQKRLGIDLKTDLVHALAGQALLVAYGVHPDLIAYLQRRPNVVGRLLDVALLIEITDPAKGQTLLKRLAQTPELKASESSPGVFFFAFDPKFPLFATVQGRSLIFALGQKALRLSLQGDPLPFAAHRKTLSSRRGAGFYLSFLALRTLISQLSIPAQQRMLLSMALPALSGLQTTTARVSVGPSSVLIQAEISLTP